jgi:type IV secretory pathway VirB6-like protein
VSQIFTCGLSDLLLLAVGSLVVFVLREYILKVDTLLLKQKNLPVLDITGFFFRIRTQVTALVLRSIIFMIVICLQKH